jgi:hypothetical protein
MKYKISILRTSYSFQEIEVEADSEAEALDIADDEAGDLNYSEKTAEYSFPDGAIKI